jgi:putative spermidine/putrescine transport system substrate-binding protein
MIVFRLTLLMCLLVTGIVGGVVLSASADELVVATFGGTFVDNSKKCHAAAFEKATGSTVKYVLGSSVQTMAKLRAAGARSELDVAYMDSQIVKQAKAEGLLQPLESAKIAGWSDLYDASRDKDSYWVSMMFAGTIITYNTNLVKTPPTSWADLWKPEWKGKLAIPDISGTSGQQFLMAAARLHGGSVENIDPGFEAIKKLKPNIQMMYTQPDQIIPLFERGDIALAVWYTDRTGAAALKGVPVAAAYPKEGGIGIVPTVSVPKASGKRELAQRYIAVLLSPEGQLCFGQSQFAGPTNKKVQLPPDLAKLVPYGPIVERMFFPDTDLVAKKFPEWSERWGREIAR